MILDCLYALNYQNIQNLDNRHIVYILIDNSPADLTLLRESIMLSYGRPIIYIIIGVGNCEFSSLITYLSEVSSKEKYMNVMFFYKIEKKENMNELKLNIKRNIIEFIDGF